MIPLDGLLVPEILWHSCDGMMVIDEHRRILAMNSAMEQLTGRSAEKAVGKAECGVLFSCRDLKGCPLAEHPEECPGLKAMQQFKPIHSVEYSIRTVEGKGKVLSASYTPIQLPERPVWALVILRDVTQQKRRERQLARQAMTDPLTGLSNRTAFLETFFKELKRAARHSRPLAVAMADLDWFKPYNDRFGHLAGDDLLKTLAGLLRAGRRVTDLITRYGGDEFAFLFPETDAAGAMAVMERVCYTIARFPFVRPGMPPDQTPAPITISIGVALFPEDGISVEALLSRADRRLYEAKQNGGNGVLGPT